MLAFVYGKRDGETRVRTSGRVCEKLGKRGVVDSGYAIIL
jgi:hypothetical protein